MEKKKRTQKEPPPTVITLTLPTPQGGGIAQERATATLLIQRGDLAQMRQFYYHGYLPDVMTAIREATEALGVLEDDNPPVVPDAPKTTRRTNESTNDDTAQEDTEPTIDIPLKKGMKAVKISHLKIVSGDTNAAAYRLAVQIAAKLIGGGLWSGETPIRIHDAHATLKQMAHLTDKEMSLFSLDDFVETSNSD